MLQPMMMLTPCFTPAHHASQRNPLSFPVVFVELNSNGTTLVALYVLSLSISPSLPDLSIVFNVFKMGRKSIRWLCMMMPFTHPRSQHRRNPRFSSIHTYERVRLCPRLPHTRVRAHTHTHTLDADSRQKSLLSRRLISASFCVDTVFHAAHKKLQRFSASHSVG